MAKLKFNKHVDIWELETYLITECGFSKAELKNKNSGSQLLRDLDPQSNGDLCILGLQDLQTDILDDQEELEFAEETRPLYLKVCKALIEKGYKKDIWVHCWW